MEAPDPSRLEEAIRIAMAQLHCSEDEALAHMRVRIARTSLTLDDLAPLVIEGLVRFSP
jgi:AmiR/NasT family two-component response regulator